MKAEFETYDGKVTLKVYYDPALCNWDKAIAAGMASFGLNPGQAAILALPIPHPGSPTVLFFTKEKQWSDGQQWRAR
jgi:hypothetical protein